MLLMRVDRVVMNTWNKEENVLWLSLLSSILIRAVI